MKDIQVSVISSDPELVHLIQSTLTLDNPHYLPHPPFIIHQFPEDELSQLESFKGYQVLIFDDTDRKKQQHTCERLLKKIPDLPIIILEPDSDDETILSKEPNSCAFISKRDVGNPLFQQLILRIISEFEISHSLKTVQEKLNKRIKELQAIRQASLHITENLSLEKVLNGIVDVALELSGADDCRIYLYEYGNLSDGTIWGFDFDEPISEHNKPPKDNLYMVTLDGKINLVEDNSLHPGYIYNDWQGSVYDLELKTSHSTIGGLAIGFREIHHFSKSEKNTIQMLVDQAAIAIENARLFKITNQIAVVNERNRLARELHDSVAQALYGITLFAKASQRKITDQKDDVIKDQMKTIQATALDALREMRLLLFELRPPQVESKGLIPALIARLEAVEERSGLTVNFSMDGNLNIVNPIQDTLFLLAQEALNNSLKHSQASTLTVVLRSNSSGTELIISDDGIGFNTDILQCNSGMGMISMKERVMQIGGEIQINSSPGEGTSVIVKVPNE